MYGDGEAFFGIILAYNVLVEHFLDLAWSGYGVEQGLFVGLFAFFLPYDVRAEIDATGTDINAVGSLDDGTDFSFTFPAKAADPGASSGGSRAAFFTCSHNAESFRALL